MKKVHLGKYGNTVIAVFTLGEVSKGFIDFVMDTLSNFYTAIRNPPGFVEVYIYSSRVEKLTHLESEARDLGIVTIGDFITLHEAWRGYPRIHISLEELINIPKSIAIALLIHEAAHSVLHGSLQYYMISIIDDELLIKLDREELFKAMYIVSTAIKDLEVSHYLITTGFLKELIIYSKYTVKQLENVECRRDFMTIAHMSKLLAPLIPLNEVLRNEVLRSYIASKQVCEEIIKEIIKILKNTMNIPRDLSMRVSFVLRKLLDISKFNH